MIYGHWTYSPKTDFYVEHWRRCDHTLICIYPYTQSGRNIWVNWPMDHSKMGRTSTKTFETTQLEKAFKKALKEPLFSPCTCSSTQALLSELLLLELEEKGVIKL